MVQMKDNCIIGTDGMHICMLLELLQHHLHVFKMVMIIVAAYMHAS